VTATLSRPEVAPIISSVRKTQSGRLLARIITNTHGKQQPYDVILDPSKDDIWKGQLMIGSTVDESVEVLCDMEASQLLIGNILVKGLPLNNLRQYAGSGPVDVDTIEADRILGRGHGLASVLGGKGKIERTGRGRYSRASLEAYVAQRDQTRSAAGASPRKSVPKKKKRGRSVVKAPLGTYTSAQAAEIVGVSIDGIRKASDVSGRIVRVSPRGRGQVAYYSQESVDAYAEDRAAGRLKNEGITVKCRIPRNLRRLRLLYRRLLRLQRLLILGPW